MDQLGSLDSSRDLQTSSVIYFVISLCLVLQIQKDIFSKTLQNATKQDLICAPAFTGRSSDFATVAPWKPRYFLISQQKILKAQRARSQKKIFLSSVTDCQISLNNSRISIWYTIRDAPRAKHIQKLATRIPIILGPITNRIHDLFFFLDNHHSSGSRANAVFFIYGKTRLQTTCARSREYRSINN